VLFRRPADAARLLIAALLLAGCGARARWVVPEAPLATIDAPPPPTPPPAEGYPEAARAVPLAVEVVVGERRSRLRARCRVGVWTSLVDLAGEDFVVRESWGRLGERRPRLLLRVNDQVLSGVTVRLRPTDDGAVEFMAEIAGIDVRAPEILEEWFGETVSLRRPRRHGYRFEGRAPAAGPALLASWGERLRVVLLAGVDGEADAEDATPAAPAPGVRFAVDGWSGSVAGREVRVERFVEDWAVVPARAIVADGVQRKEWRLAPDLASAGFRVAEDGAVETWGAPFEVEAIPGA